MKLKAAKEQESEHQKSEIDDKEMYYDDQPTKYRSIKPNNIPTALLILAFILVNLKVSNGISCSKPSDIKWISKKTNKVVGCTPCIRCPASQEYSIPCGTEAYIGTNATCVPCPSGKYSDGFKTNPCVACTECSNRVVKQNCTSSRNAVCGDCLPGYYFDIFSFDCRKCAKCCHDGQDETHSSCSAIGRCKPRPFGCPVIPTTKSAPTSSNITASTLSGKHKQTLWTFFNTKSTTEPKVTSKTVRSINQYGTGQSDAGTNTTIPSAARAQQSAQEYKPSNSQNTWLITFLVTILVIVIILIIVVVIIFTIKFRKLKKATKNAVTAYKPISQNPSTMSQMEMGEVVNHSTAHEPSVSHEDPSTSQMERGEGVNQTAQEAVKHEDPSTSQMERGEGVEHTAACEPYSQDPSTLQLEMGEDKTLEELLDKNFNIVDRLCKILRKESERLFDFERLAMVWGIRGDDVRCINNEIHARNGSPVRKLLDVLCTQRLCTTVKQLADSIKDINSEAYELLKPHFLKPKEDLTEKAAS